jgi:prolyl oligopeptidase PreP (S9A serine peptidase family)
MHKSIKWIAGSALTVAILLLFFFVMSLNGEKQSLQTKCNALAQKNELLLKKVREEKTKMETMMYKNRTVDSQQASLRKELAQWEEKWKLLSSEKEALQNEMVSQRKIQTERMNECSSRITVMKSEKNALETKHQESLKVIGELNSTLKSEKKEREALDAKLKRSGIKLSQCEEKNAKLCTISTGLINQFENQSLFGNLLKQENIVQLKRVEMEKMVQEYQDKIEELQLEE